MKAILVLPLSQTCNKFHELGKLMRSFVRSWAETVHVLPFNKLFTTSASVKATALQWNNEPKRTFKNINKALSDDPISKGCTHKCNEWCIIMYSISILNCTKSWCVNCDTPPIHSVRVYEQFLHSISHPEIRATQKLISVNISLYVHKWAPSYQDKCTDILYM